MTHADWSARGFGLWVLPIIPPGVVLSPDSKVPPDQRGKVPGVCGHQGWHGLMGWRGNEAAPADLARWTAMGSGVALQARAFPGCDIDVTQAGLADAIAALARRVLGPAPGRVGRAPRVLLPYRLADGAEPFGKTRVAFVLAGEKHAVEFMADNQQYVVEGTHPGTGQPYRWLDGQPPLAEALTPIDGEKVAAFFVALRGLLDTVGAVDVKQESLRVAGDAPAPESLLAPSEAALEAALAKVVNEGSREHWVRVGAAIKGAGGTEEQWLEWSGTGQGQAEDPADIAARWKGFGQPRIGWGALEGWARAGGWTGGPDLDFAGFGKLAEELGGDDTLQARAFREWRWVKAIERFGSVVTGELLSSLNFSVELNWWGPPKSSSKSAAAQFLADARCVKLDGMTYLPGAGREVVEPGLGRCFNTWRPSDLVPATGEGASTEAVARWLAHWERLIPDRRKREIMLNWCAFVLQRPDRKVNWAPLLVSKEGAGKDWLLHPVVAALGSHNVSVISVAEAESDFNDWCAAVRLVIFNEAHSSGRVKQNDRMKPHNAAPPDMIGINRKGVPRWQQPNRHCMFYTSNRLDAVAIGDGDRRYFVVRIEFEKQSDDWWDEAWGWMRGGGASAVAGWLLARDISGFLTTAAGRAPWTEEKEDMARDTASELHTAVTDGLDDWPDLVNPGDLAARMNAIAGRSSRTVSGRGVAVVLRETGARNVNSGAMVRLAAPCATGADRVRLMSIRNHATYTGMPATALARNFTQGWATRDGKAAAEFQPYAVKPVTDGENLL